jgi:hypothetical protein
MNQQHDTKMVWMHTTRSSDFTMVWFMTKLPLVLPLSDQKNHSKNTNKAKCTDINMQINGIYSAEACLASAKAKVCNRNY